MEKFKPGDIAISKVDMVFMDETSHHPGQEILVTEANMYL